MRTVSRQGIKWAQEHPNDVARIVQHAKSFYRFYLSQRGEECFAVQMLEEYLDYSL